MLLLKYLLMWGGIGMIALAAGILAYDFYLEMKYRQALASGWCGTAASGPTGALANLSSAGIAGLGPDCVVSGHRGCAQRHGRSAG